jgi:hypothetical protein
MKWHLAASYAIYKRLNNVFIQPFVASMGNSNVLFGLIKSPVRFDDRI